MDISFYHLEKTPLEKGCGQLLEKILLKGKKAVVLCEDEEKMQHLNTVLWTYATMAFLPHGSHKEGFAAHQPIWLTTHMENPNQAEILVTLCPQPLENDLPFIRCLDIFDGMDETAIRDARVRWRAYAARGDSVTYWKQNEAGAWEQPNMA